MPTARPCFWRSVLCAVAQSGETFKSRLVYREVVQQDRGVLQRVNAATVRAELSGQACQSRHVPLATWLLPRPAIWHQMQRAHRLRTGSRGWQSCSRSAHRPKSPTTQLHRGWMSNGPPTPRCTAADTSGAPGRRPRDCIAEGSGTLPRHDSAHPPTEHLWHCRLFVLHHHWPSTKVGVVKDGVSLTWWMGVNHLRHKSQEPQRSEPREVARGWRPWLAETIAVLSHDRRGVLTAIERFSRVLVGHFLNLSGWNRHTARCDAPPSQASPPPPSALPSEVPSGETGSASGEGTRPVTLRAIARLERGCSTALWCRREYIPSAGILDRLWQHQATP